VRDKIIGRHKLRKRNRKWTPETKSSTVTHTYRFFGKWKWA